MDRFPPAHRVSSDLVSSMAPGPSFRPPRQTAREPISYAPPKYPEIAHSRPTAPKKPKPKPPAASTTSKPGPGRPRLHGALRRPHQPPPPPPPQPREPETVVVSHIPKTNVVVEIPPYPELRPELLPPLEPLTLLPVHDSTAYIIESYLLPATRVSPRDGRLLPKELGFLIGWTDLPAARLVVPLTQLLDYVSPYTYEQWEQEQERKREAVRREVLAAARAADEALEAEAATAARFPVPAPDSQGTAVAGKRRGRPRKHVPAEDIGGATLMAGSLLAPEELPVDAEDDEEDEDIPPVVRQPGLSMLTPGKRPMQVVEYPDTDEVGDEEEEEDELGQEMAYHQAQNLGGGAGRLRASSLLAPPAPTSLAAQLGPRSPPKSHGIGSLPEKWHVPSLSSVPRPLSQATLLTKGVKRKRDADRLSAGPLRQTTLGGGTARAFVSTSTPKPRPPSKSAPPSSQQQRQTDSVVKRRDQYTKLPGLSKGEQIARDLRGPDLPQTPVYAKTFGMTESGDGGGEDGDGDELGMDEYAVERIQRMDVRPYHGRPRRYFEVFWEGFSEPTWEPQANLPRELVDDFFDANPRLIRDSLRSLELRGYVLSGGGQTPPAGAAPSAKAGKGGGSSAKSSRARTPKMGAPTSATKPAPAPSAMAAAAARQGATGAGGASKGGGRQTTLQWPLSGVKKHKSVMDLMEHDYDDEALRTGSHRGAGGYGAGEYARDDDGDDEDGDEVLVVE